MTGCFCALKGLKLGLDITPKLMSGSEVGVEIVADAGRFEDCCSGGRIAFGGYLAKNFNNLGGRLFARPI